MTSTIIIALRYVRISWICTLFSLNHSNNSRQWFLFKIDCLIISTSQVSNSNSSIGEVWILLFSDSPTPWKIWSPSMGEVWRTTRYIPTLFRPFPPLGNLIPLHGWGIDIFKTAMVYMSIYNIFTARLFY